MSGTIRQFEDLSCWKEARVLVKMIYSLTTSEPFSKDFGLRDQIQRSSVSVMSNIAEGFDSSTNAEFIRFLRYATRSCSETQSQLYIARDIHYIDDYLFNETMEQARKCSALMKALIKYLRKNIHFSSLTNVCTPERPYVRTQKGAYNG